MRLSIISAAKFEVLPLLSLLERVGCSFEYVSFGVGSIESAKNSRSLARRCEGRDVLYIGTCGTFSGWVSPQLIYARKLFWLPPCVRVGIAWSIEELKSGISLPSPPVWLEVLPQKTVLCSSSIAKSPFVSPELMESFSLISMDCLVENLELYSCAVDVLKYAKSFIAILGVTNGIGLQGRLEWRSNFQEVAEMTADFIEFHLASIFV